ncbi:MAG: alpha/beta hydrolase fold domain-containing protein [Chthoniobacter sp.]|nr:alpha/beta hydrolase fold domain-containing protein [Chthoniobacter sp.]
MKKLIILLLACTAMAASAAIVPENFVKNNDRNGDGKLSRDEFPEWAKSKFDLIDANHDGFVTVEEMRTFVENQGGDPAAAATAGGKKPAGAGPVLPTPTHANVAYGPDESNVLDYWQAPTGAPNPLLVIIHGGGFRAGSKAQIAPQFLQACLQAGISVASIEYRFTQKAPYPAQMMDCARALQFIRSKADEWGFDRKRVAATGGSAGAGISLWLGFHKDLADPNSSDPVARESTRLTCILPTQMQCTYDPRVIKTLIPGNAYDVSAIKFLFGVPVTFNWDTDTISPELDAKIKDAAPITHLTKDAPPVFAVSEKASDVPGNIHNANFERHLKKLMDALGVECTIHLDADFATPQAALDEKMAFLKKHLGVAERK